MFHLSCIREAHGLDIHFDAPEKFNPLQVWLSPGESEIVRIKILPSASRWVKEKAWDTAWKFEEAGEDGAVILKMQIPADMWGKESIKRWILHLGAEAEVLEPVWLRQEIAEILQKAAKNYP